MPNDPRQDETLDSHLVRAPDGSKIEIPKELFSALEDFLVKDGPTGSVTIHFRNGGVAGIEALTKRAYK